MFLIGLHRSATTLIAQTLAEHPECSGFRSTGAPMDEGQYLQTVYRGRDGRVLDSVGSLALKPANRLTEHALEATEENAQRLWAEWAPYWDTSKRFLIEKSPGNMTKTRFLQALFPGAIFVVICRHPIANAMAIRKWVGNRSVLQHVANWTAAHRMIRRDASHLSRVAYLRYEDFCADPERVIGALLAFLGARDMPLTHGRFESSNERYLRDWEALRLRPAVAVQATAIHTLLAREPRLWGYLLRSSGADHVAKPRVTEIPRLS